jgi:hypothetical protein
MCSQYYTKIAARGGSTMLLQRVADCVCAKRVAAPRTADRATVAQVLLHVLCDNPVDQPCLQRSAAAPQLT